MAHTDTHAHRGASIRHRNAADLHPRFRKGKGTPADDAPVAVVGAHMVTRPALRPGKTARKRVNAAYAWLLVVEGNLARAQAHYGPEDAHIVRMYREDWMAARADYARVFAAYEAA